VVNHWHSRANKEAYRKNRHPFRNLSPVLRRLCDQRQTAEKMFQRNRFECTIARRSLVARRVQKSPDAICILVEDGLKKAFRKRFEAWVVYSDLVGRSVLIHRAVPLYFLATFFLLLIRFTNTIQVLLRFLLRALPAINLSIFQNGKSTYE